MNDGNFCVFYTFSGMLKLGFTTTLAALSVEARVLLGSFPKLIHRSLLRKVCFIIIAVVVGAFSNPMFNQ